MHLTTKIKIYPTEEQLKALWGLSDKCCSLYSLALAERKDAWKLERKSIKYVDQQNKLPDFKKINPEYRDVYSKTLQGVLKKLDANYRSFLALRGVLNSNRFIQIGFTTGQLVFSILYSSRHSININYVFLLFPNIHSLK